ncbi:MAG: trimethylamine methyltransferase family protein, partial [Rhodobiaceae bacterium]|nr:trimethylamine methyltransferase family protein [Rhodobiaceae bacterium]
MRSSDTLVSETPRPQRGRRQGGRAGNARGHRKGIAQAPWTIPVNSDRPTEPVDQEAVEAIHNGAMRILEEIGIDFLNEESKAILKQAGCNVDPGSDRLRMDRGFVMEMVKRAPSQFDITPRNPDRRITIGGKHMTFVNVSSPPNYMTLDEGRKSGNRKAFQDLIKLSQYFNCIHKIGGYPVEPVDIHASIRHLDCLYDKLTLSDKVCHAYCLGKERVEDVMEMVRIAGGLTHEEFDAAPRMYTNINSSSPLKHDYPMLDGAMRMARRGQPVVVTPFTLAGAMAPVTLAGAVTQSIAEALAAIALLQVIRPGVPVAYGSFTSNVDMKSGAPAFGTPEYMRATQISGQMARYYNLPFRASNACAANAPDAQAAWESAFSLWACVSSGVNMVYHAAGWLEGGL